MRFIIIAAAAMFMSGCVHLINVETSGLGPCRSVIFLYSHTSGVCE